MDAALADAVAPGETDGLGRPAGGPHTRACSYDEVPYSIGAFPQTRPDRLATIATLLGMAPAHPARCRVLELGCAGGGNLIPMALADPASEYLGIDLSARQIADGQAAVSELGLSNVELRQADILEVGDAIGRFDYILCHGVYSWVTPAVQAAILRICRRNLADQGVAYISYNCYPGWHARGALREMLWYHTERFTDPAQRVRAARGLLGLLARSAAARGDGGYSALVRQELHVLLATPDSYLLHEHLEEFNEPLYFHQFARRAADAGLQYLGEADVTAMVAGQFGPEGENALREIAPDLLHMEQYMDFLRNRMFRQTLLCHAETRLDSAMRSEAVRSMFIASPARTASSETDLSADVDVEYRCSSPAALSTRDPLMKAAMAVLARSWPASIRFDQLVLAAQQRLADAHVQCEAQSESALAQRLLNCFTLGLVELSVGPPAFVTTVSDRPVASPYARVQARAGRKITNMKLQSVMMGQPAATVLEQLDGTHDAMALGESVAAWLSAQPPQGASPPTPEAIRNAAREYVAKVLPVFAQSALLVG